MRKILLFSSLFLFLAACGKGDEASVPTSLTQLVSEKLFFGSCDHTQLERSNLRKCREWYGTYFESINLDFTCSSIFKGTYSAESCKLDGLIGVCKIYEEEEKQIFLYYYESDWEVEKAQKNCEDRVRKSTWYLASEFVDDNGSNDTTQTN